MCVKFIQKWVNYDAVIIYRYIYNLFVFRNVSKRAYIAYLQSLAKINRNSWYLHTTAIIQYYNKHHIQRHTRTLTLHIGVIRKYQS